MNKNKTKKPKKKNAILRNFRFFFPIAFKKYPGYIALNIFKTILNGLIPLINVIFPPLIIAELITIINNQSGNNDYFMLIMYVLVVVVGNALAQFIYIWLDNRFLLYNDKLAKHFDTILNYQAMRMDYEKVEDPKIGDLLERANLGMNNYTYGVAAVMEKITQIISNIITVLGIITILFTVGIPLIMILAIMAVTVNLIVRHHQNKLSVNFEKENIRRNRRFSYFFFNLVHISNAKDIRLYHASEMVKDVGLADSEEMADAYRKLANKQARLNVIRTIYINLIDRILFYGILFLTMRDNAAITIPVLTEIITAYETFSLSMSNIMWNINDLARDVNYQEPYIDFMEFPIDKKTGFLLPDPQIRKIEFKNVSFKYPNTDNYILENISLTVSNQERLSIVGLNGAGKTTLIKLLCRLYDVNEGEILVNDINIKDYDYEEYLKLFAIVFQDFKIISFTVRENIEILENDQKELYDTLKRAGIYERINELPHKENTFVNKWFDKEGVEFSGGELQKIAIARALYKNGSIVILDEPTAALDPIAEAEIYYRFNEVIGQKLTIFISHRLSSCKFCDRILVLDGKKIIEVGTHAELMAKENGVYKEMFNTQAQYYKN